ncbi:putative isoaspartyl peptidase/L-asparaginase 2 [Triticum urartu]|uniref:Putative isoaspartyl peptidase/L-asparaginase 2 n=1 Tax=Triticum urartu TaxID=4572 RepID=M7ZTD5_TRIUA|nr:putative isoaspartyl peptidase/L-asparaginase 2 [Triticum urartu]
MGISVHLPAFAFVSLKAVVRELETDPCFNSGRGSALTRAGTVEMEASIMDGHGRRCGAVSGVSTVRNPVSLARRVMDKSPHSYLAFDGAEDFAREQGLEVVDNSYFITEENRLDEGFAGLIAVSGTGEVAYGFNCTGMFRGCATEDGFMEVGIWE